MADTVRIVSPVDGSIFAERPLADGSAIDAALARARAARRLWSGVDLRERAQAVTRFVDALLAINAEIVPELAWQMGRPVRWRGEAGGVEERARHMIAIAPEALAPIVGPDRQGFQRYVTREPVGTLLVIAPWNYPYMTALNSIVPGLMAGNAILLKHASQTLLVGERLAQAAKVAELPEGLFQNIVLSHADTEKLIGSGAVDHVQFTGSVAGGRAIERAAAGTFATIGLELGGKDPAYVRADADLDNAVENLAEGAFFNSGQSCCGVERIYVEDALYDDFVERFLVSARDWTLGNPLDAQTKVGPMAQGRFADHVRGQIAEAVRKGARPLLGTPDTHGEGSPYLAPEVLVDVNHQMGVMIEESFGPVVGIMKVSGDAEAITLMNDSPYGLTASVWTADIAAAARIGAQIETGTVFANRCDYIDPALCWTGVKDTGRGGAMGEIGYHALTQPKSYHLKSL